MGGGGGCYKNYGPLLFGLKSMNLLVLFDFDLKSVVGSQLGGACMGRSGTSVDAVYAVVGLFCYVSSFGDFGDPVLPTLRRVSGDVVTVCAY